MYTIAMSPEMQVLTGATSQRNAWASPSGADGVPEAEGVVFARGRRVLLRTLSRADLPCLSAWARSAFLQETVGSELLQTFRNIYRESPAFIDMLRADASQLNLVIEVDGRDTPVGLVRLFNIHREDGYAFFETMVAEPHALRLGFGIEASKLLAYYAIDVMGLRRLEAKVYETNRLSINTMKRRHWKLEGTLRQAVYRHGRHENLLVFGILRDEIAANKRDDTWTPVYPGLTTA